MTPPLASWSKLPFPVSISLVLQPCRISCNLRLHPTPALPPTFKRIFPFRNQGREVANVSPHPPIIILVPYPLEGEFPTPDAMMIGAMKIVDATTTSDTALGGTAIGISTIIGIRTINDLRASIAMNDDRMRFMSKRSAEGKRQAGQLEDDPQ